MADSDELFDLLLEQAGLATPALETLPTLDPALPGPLSPGQRRLWLLDRMEGPSCRYNLGMGLRLGGALDTGALERALAIILARHEPLRTLIPSREGEPAPRILPPAPVRLEPVAVAAEALAGACQRVMDQPFALDREIPVRFALFALGPEEHTLVVCVHHIAADGWSFTVLIEELEAAYRAFAAGVPPELPPIAARYAQFAAWQERAPERDEDGIRFWREHLRDAPAFLDLPLDHPRGKTGRAHAGNHDLHLPAALIGRLRDLAASRNATLPMALLAGFAALLCRYARQEQLVVGLPAANRPRPAMAGLIGFFVNTLALRLHCEPGTSFLSLLEATADALLEGLRHEDTPFEAVVEAVNPDRSQRQTPLFQVMFAYQSMTHRAPRLPGLQTGIQFLANSAPLFDLFLMLEEAADGGLFCRLTYDAELFEPVSAQRLGDNFRQLLTSAVADPHQPLASLDLLDPGQRRLLLETWQGAPLPPAPGSAATLTRLLAERAQATPAAVILHLPGGGTLTCGELLDQARDLAWDFLNRGIRKGDPVGLLLPRSADWLRAMAALLLIECPWVALDPAAPILQLEQISEAAHLRALVTPAAVPETLPPGLVLPCRASTPAPADFVPSGLDSQPDDTAYLLFTSGSTGRPKGVIGSHRGIVNRLRWQWSRYPYQPGEVCCLRAAVTFVDALAEAFGPLLAGVPAVILADAEVRDPARLLARLAETGVSRLLLVPSLLKLLLDAEPDLGARLPRLQLWTVSGERMPGDLTARFQRAAPQARLLNIYGSSEVSADVTWHELQATEPLDGSMAIGRPLPGNRIYILDERGQLLPPGVPGILHVAGEHLSKGYLDDPAGTAAAFLPELPGQGPAASRMFCTRDVARFRHDGVLEYLGRDDFMISLHGLRIEPGEVEACLRSHPEVRDGAVAQALLPGGEPLLAAYVVLEPGAALTVAALQGYLGQRLPTTRVPHRYLRLEQLPLLANGKLDRKALPPLDQAEALPLGSLDAAPSTAEERLVAAVMAELLGQAQASVQQNFFMAGGHSLLAVRLAAKLAEASGRSFPVEQVFTTPTVAGMAHWLETAAAETGPVLAPLAPGAAHPLSPAQRRFWIQQQLEGAEGAYVIRGRFRLRGPLDSQVLGQALGHLLARHLPLRTLYGAELGQPSLRLLSVPDALQASYRIEDLAPLPEAQRQARLAELETALGESVFHLASEPPLRLRLLTLEGAAILVHEIHHIAWDGWSAEVFFAELGSAYRALAQGNEPSFPALPISYPDYAAWSQARHQAGLLAADAAYWRATLEGAPQRIALGAAEAPPSSELGAVLRCHLEAAASQRLRAHARRRGETLHIALLSLFAGLLAVHSGQSDLVIGVVSANRPHRALHGLVGFFANALPVRFQLDGVGSLNALLDLTRRLSQEAQAHQELPFDLIVQELKVERIHGHTPLFQVLFSHQNEPLGQLDLADVTVEPMDQDRTRTALDLVFEVQPDAAGGLHLDITYASSRFPAAFVERLARHYLTLCRGLAETEDLDLDWRALPLADLAEQALVAGFAEGRALVLPEPCLLHELIQARALEAPEALAVDGPLGSLTRRELDAKAGTIAAWLGPQLPDQGEPLVALCLEPGPDFVAAWLGILKAGAAVLPLDPAWPPERVQRILGEARPALLLQDLAELTPAAAGAARPTWAARALPRDGRHLAYVIATSGTTGTPKATAVEHRSLVNLALAQAALYGVDAGTRCLLLASPAFDVAMGELATILMAGATLVLAPREAAVPGRDLVDFLAATGITHLSCAPSAMSVLPAEAAAALPDLACLVLGGESTPASLAAHWGQGRRLFNAYGPTEATVCATATPYRSAQDIGRPLANVAALVLDPEGRALPIGAPGELCLGGVGVARGYLHRAELTRKVFVERDGQRLYRTGDRARWRPDGHLEFLGRMDDQVKIRGVRIEPAEIAAQLEAFPEVARAVVLARTQDGRTRLVAYYVPAADHPDATPDALRQRLKTQLQSQAVPDRLMALATLPLNANGKVDLAALPPITEPAAASPALPATHLRRVLSGIWQEVLGHLPGEQENFFDAGGHSLLLAQVQALIEARCQRRVSVVDLFRHPTIAALAEALSDPQAAPPQVPAQRAGSGAVAIVGMACRLPGAPDLEAFWQALCEGRELLKTYTDEELLAAGVAPALLADPAYVRVGGHLEGTDQFDAAFFGISPGEADTMDPQQRVFLQCAWHALEHAGHGASQLNAAVFAGSGMNRYLAKAFPAGLPVSAAGFAAITGNGPDFLATRAAYLLNLTGPAISLQTACSTSLTAVVLACQCLREGKADFALAGGVSLPLGPQGYPYREGMIFSPDGHCRPFDAAAQGTVPSGGCGVVVLRPLEAALADGDTVYAVIRGAAVNNDGSAKAGYTAPGVAGQAAVIRAALADAGAPASRIGYVETHGTGTVLGDPIEVAALGQAYGLGPGQAIALGSVKANLGHADSAAGVVGLIKAALCLWHGEIPTTPHFTQPNPRLELPSGPFFVPATRMPWTTAGAPRMAGVSSFGIGGTNAHVVLEEASRERPGAEPGPWRVLALAAKDDRALEELAGALSRHLESRPVSLDDVALTLARGRAPLPVRRAVICRDLAAAAGLLAGQAAATAFELQGAARSSAPPILFLLPGQGSQYPGMAAGLYAAEPVFADLLDRCRDLLLPLLGRDILPLLLDPHREPAELADTAVAQPLLFSVSFALAGLLEHHGLRPAALLGHSLGELTAACLAGVWPLADGLRIVAERGRLMAAMEPGSMLSTSLTEAEAQALLPAFPGLALAAVNGPRTCTLSGPRAVVAQVALELQRQGSDCLGLQTSHAFHSAMMAPAAAALGRFMAGFQAVLPRVPVYSNVTGAPLTDQEILDPAYWSRQMLAPVRFAPALAAATEAGFLSIEVGPGRGLSGLAAAAGMEAVRTLRHPKDPRDDHAVFLEAVARLWLAGAAPDFAASLPASARRIALPAYPFARDRHWLEASVSAPQEAHSDPSRWLYAPAWRAAPQGSPDPFPRRWLLLMGRDPLGAQVLANLQARGADVVPVRLAEATELEALLASLAAEQRLPEAVLHLGCLDLPEDQTLDDPALEGSLFSFLDLVKALAGMDTPCRVGAVSRGLHRVRGDEHGARLAAATLGACKVIPTEEEQLLCRALDVAPEGLAADELLEEFLAGREPVVALRGGRRWLPVWTPVPLPAPAASPFRPQGVYWITGGLGGVGLGLARQLATHFQARLLLTSRSAQDGIQAVAELQALGAEVLVLAADAADPAAMAAAQRQATARFGAFDGVIHAAGLVDEGGIARRRTRAGTLPVLAPKLAGTLNLIALLGRQQAPAFLVLCSSLGNLLPGSKFAQVGYAAANEFLDACAGPAGNLRILTINWDDWTEAGMSVRAGERWRRQHHLQADPDHGPGLTMAQGFAVLSRILAAAEPHLAVSVRDLFGLMAEDGSASLRMAARLAPAAATASHARPQQATAFVAPAPGLETDLALIWQETLGIDQVGAKDDFFQLGGHSLLAMRLIPLVRERLGLPMNMGALFEAPTLEAMARLIGQDRPAQPGAAEQEDEEHVI